VRACVRACVRAIVLIYMYKHMSFAVTLWCMYIVCLLIVL